MKRNVYRFKKCLVDVQARELRRGGEILTVSPKVFDCIVYLIEHRERAVGHDELVSAVWGHVDVAEVQLRHLVRKVRSAVGGKTAAEDPIRTIPRFGYRWIGPVVSEAAVIPDLDRCSPLATPRRASAKARARASLLRVGIGISILVIGVAIFAYAPFFRDTAHRIANSTTEPGPTRPLAAVLPVKTFQIEEDSAWMRLGLMDLMIDHLRGAGVIVVPSADIVALDNDKRSDGHLADMVQKASGVEYVIAPRVLREKDRWRVEVELSRPDGSSHKLQARAADVIVAVHEASDRLLSELGAPSTTGKTDPSLGQVAELRQRVEAAALAGNIESAQRILDAAPDALKTDPHVELLHAKIDLAGGAADSVDERLGVLLRSVAPEGDALFRAEILDEMGAAERQTGRWDLATQRFDESIRLLEKLNQPLTLGHAYVGRGAVSALLGRYDDAQSDFSHAQVAFELTGDALEGARAEMNEGALEEMRGHPSQGLRLLAQAAEGLQRFSDHSWLVNALANMISADLDLLQPADAAAVAERMDRELPEMGSSVHARMARLQYVPALIRSGRIEDARSLVAELRREEESRHEVAFIGFVSLYEAELAVASHDPDSELHAAESAKDELDEREYDDERSVAWLLETRALRELARREDAAVDVHKLATWAEERRTPKALLNARLAQAEQAALEGRVDAASELYDVALHDAHVRGLPSEVADVVISYGEMLMRHRDLARAAMIVGQIAPWIDQDFDCAILQLRLYHALGRLDAWRASFDRARALAGERDIPVDLAQPPRSDAALANSP